MKVNIYNKEAAKPCFYDGFTGAVITAMIMITVETALLPGGSFVNFFSLIVSSLLMRAYSNVRDETSYLSDEILSDVIYGVHEFVYDWWNATNIWCIETLEAW